MLSLVTVWTAILSLMTLEVSSSTFLHYLPQRPQRPQRPQKKSFVQAGPSNEELLEQIKQLKTQFQTMEHEAKENKHEVSDLKHEVSDLKKDNVVMMARWSTIDKGFTHRSIARQQEKMFLHELNLGNKITSFGGILNKYEHHIERNDIEAANALMKKINCGLKQNPFFEGYHEDEWTIEKVRHLNSVIEEKKDVGNWFAHKAQPSETFTSGDFVRYKDSFSDFEEMKPVLIALDKMLFVLDDAINIKLENVTIIDDPTTMNLSGLSNAFWVKAADVPSLSDVKHLLMVEFPSTGNQDEDRIWNLKKFLQSSVKHHHSFPPCRFYVRPDLFHPSEILLRTGFEIPHDHVKNEPFIKDFVNDLIKAAS